MTAITSRYLTLPVADGTTMRTYLSRPQEKGPQPGLLVFQEAFGVNAHIRDVTDRFARSGYVALACELFHRTAPGFEGAYGEIDRALENVRALTQAGLEADVDAGYAWLQSEAGAPRQPVAAVGFCMGGRVAFLANARLPLAAAVSFYGGGIAPGSQGPGLLDRTPDLHGAMLFFWGLRDPHIGIEPPRAVADALRQAGKPFTTVEFSEADHGFFCDARPSYHPAAAAQAWVLTSEFLRLSLRRG